MRDARSLALLTFLAASLAAFMPACDGDGGSGQGATGATSNTGASGGTAGSSTANGGTGGSSGGAPAGGTGGTGTTGTAGAGAFIEVPCVNQTYQCGDTIDNDGDGLVDWVDPDCLGACDNTEDSFYGGIPGQPGPACTVDCYWDSNSGSGNDDCFWSHQCDPNEKIDPGHPEPNNTCAYNEDANIPGTGLGCAELSQTQSDACHDFCGPLTPNGCDCFGCCELPAGSKKFVWLGSEDEATGEGSCSLSVLDDETKCEPCVPVPSCYNDCDYCEICIGKPTLPPECNPQGTGGAGGTGVGGNGAGGGSSGQCPDGIQPCGQPGQSPCMAGFYCITGCCQPIEEPK